MILLVYKHRSTVSSLECPGKWGAGHKGCLDIESWARPGRGPRIVESLLWGWSSIHSASCDGVCGDIPFCDAACGGVACDDVSCGVCSVEPPPLRGTR